MKPETPIICYIHGVECANETPYDHKKHNVCVMCARKLEVMGDTPAGVSWANEQQNRRYSLLGYEVADAGSPRDVSDALMAALNSREFEGRPMSEILDGVAHLFAFLLAMTGQPETAVLYTIGMSARITAIQAAIAENTEAEA